MSKLLRFMLSIVMAASATVTLAQAGAKGNGDYKLAAGDTIKVQVYQNPDLTMEARVSESGTISYPLVGSVNVGGMTIP
ncbi:MAG: polysaccharide export protein EpsE, partial [Ramlibacter sp.]|nr:polysaccharide export protein EpsE [Ramlibacter sp.]